MFDRNLLTILADGKVHSGARLAESVGVSRTAVWKQLKKLEELGLIVESLKGKGYRLPGGIELLDSQRIAEELKPDILQTLGNIEIHDQLDSTNTYLSRREVGCHGVVCLAEQQTQGRGRRGRDWVSPFGRNIYLSLGWAFEGGAASLEGLSLAVGLSLLRALAVDGSSVEALGLKWPNDVLYDGRKLAGILLEMTGDPSGHCQVVIGVGVNMGMRPEHFASIDQPGADARELGVNSRNRLAANILNELLPVIRSFQQQGFRAFLDEWHQYDLCLNQTVTLSTPLSSRVGIARGVTDSGSLKLEIDGCIDVVSGGEISLRLLT